MSNILDEIPYIVTPRKDTGLFNSKIAIWLFLASEVMLFGGLFSGYIFLRIYADYPWPERALPITPGFINTFILIGSSVTVVFAWAALKMRQWRQFQIYMAITLVCAAAFMVLKGFEYSAKFAHHAVRLTDSWAVAEGHFHKGEDTQAAGGPGGEGSTPNVINFSVTGVTVDLGKYHEPYIEDLLEQSGDVSLVLTQDSLKLLETTLRREKALEEESDDDRVEFLQAAIADPKLSTDLLDDAQEMYLDFRSSNAKLRTDALRAAWEKVRRNGSSSTELNSRELAGDVKIDSAALDPHLRREVSSLTFEAAKPFKVQLSPNAVREGADKSVLLDGTVLDGELLSSPFVLAVDTLDFRHTAMKAEERQQDPMDVIENSWLITEHPEIKKVWDAHKVEVEELRQELIEKHGVDKKTGAPNRVPNENDLYRVTWQEMVTTLGEEETKPGVFAGFTGPSHSKYTFPVISVPRERVAFESNLTPKWNTYYAIYFLITGLHGLHVIGGAVVLGYYLFCGRKMYETNPEWLANRVEVGGLFWHFVDLVWIFLFPIMYLM